MKSYKPGDCDFFILNMLNEYNKASLMDSIYQDAKERQEAFKDPIEDCISIAQIFSNSILTQTGRVLANAKLVEEQPNTCEDIHNKVDFKLTALGEQTWTTLKRQFSKEVQAPGWTKLLI